LHTRDLALWKAELGIVLGDLVAAGDTEIDAALSNKRRDVSGGKEDEGDREVLDQGDIEAVLTAELDIAAGKEVEGRLLKASFCSPRGFVSRSISPGGLRPKRTSQARVG
jgi:hypothetical protein